MPLFHSTWLDISKQTSYIGNKHLWKLQTILTCSVCFLLCVFRRKESCKISFKRTYNLDYFVSIFLRFYLFIFRKMGWEGEREGEKHQCGREASIHCYSHPPEMGNQTCSPAICPDQPPNWWPFGLWDDAQPTEPGQSGLCFKFCTPNGIVL